LSYLCIDGGQTKTAVFVMDEEGEVLDSWQEDPLTTPSRPGALEKLRAMVRGICEGLSGRLKNAEHPLAAPRALCFSLTGYLEGDDRIPVLVAEEVHEVLPTVERVHTIPDYVGNWAAATRGEPGVVAISGGGAVAYGRNREGVALRVGGWGHLLGDEGSGYWIGLEALKAALRSWSGVSGKTRLERPVMERFDASTDLELIHKVYSGEVSDADIAELVPLVASLAQAGGEVSGGILDRAAYHLAKIVAAALERLGELPVYLSGGVFEAPIMQERFERALANAGLATSVATVATDPHEGIFLIAREGLA
jgi:N-acetylglucosamine kinase-like BadF-type ATPase